MNAADDYFTVLFPGLTPPPPAAQPQNRSRGLTGTLRVLQYNILADCYANTHIFPYARPHTLAWAYRYPHLLEDILHHDPDIVCLQEVQLTHFSQDFAPRLHQLAGYTGVFRKRPKPNKQDGCAVFWREDCFRMLARENWDFNRVHADLVESCESELSKCQTNNIAMAVLLEDLRGWTCKKERLWVVNTHFFWDPVKPDVKLIQAHMLLRFMGKLRQKYAEESGTAGMILCGDLNSTPGSQVYNCFAEGVELEEDAKLASVFQDAEPRFTNYTESFQGCIDYIWYSKADFLPKSRSQFPEESELCQEVALPNTRYPSDHLPLFCELQYRPTLLTGPSAPSPFVLPQQEPEHLDFETSQQHPFESEEKSPLKCRFDLKCKRFDCRYVHSALCRYGIRCVLKNTGGCKRAHVIPCRDGLDCLNVSCTYCHLPCRFGRDCTNASCMYSHSRNV